MPARPGLPKSLVAPLTACLLLALAGSVQAQSDSVLATVNRLRAAGGACSIASPPVTARPALDAAAADAARGAALEAALRSAGYRATEAQIITISGEGVRARLEGLLARRFCPRVGAPRLTEMGFHEDRRQVWIVLAAPFAPRLDLTRKQLADRMLELVNQARAQPRECGDKHFGAAPPLEWNEVLEKVAAQHAGDMAAKDYFSHEGREGSTPSQRVTRAGYRWRMTGENIAAGQPTPDAAVAGWIKSPGHCANLMNGAFTEMGVAGAVNAGSKLGVYWAQEFGTPR